MPTSKRNCTARAVQADPLLDRGGFALIAVELLVVGVGDGVEPRLVVRMQPVNLLNQASISGVVFVDVNLNGLFDSNELAIDAVLVELLDEEGNLLEATATESGFYLFEDLDPGTYRVREVQPGGVADGAEHLGSLDPAKTPKHIELWIGDPNGNWFRSYGVY